MREKDDEMSKHYYTDEKNAQIVIALLKAHGIKDIIVSPGATNDCFVLSVQDDPDFRLYSAVDERHAAYMACGMAEERGGPVVINCTGATASRNYMPGLTEAFYRKLPILVVTSSQHRSHIGNLYPQMTDRIKLPGDIVNESVQCPIPLTSEEVRDCELCVNKAILALKRNGGGPAHINLETSFNSSFSCDELPHARKIDRIEALDAEWPGLDKYGKIVVWIGSHRPFTKEETSTIEEFSLNTGAAILGDLTSNYHGSSFVFSAMLCYQTGAHVNPEYAGLKPDLIIHIGEISGDYPTSIYLRCGADVWRVNRDGELRDYFGTLKCAFQMPELEFFRHYALCASKRNCDLRKSWISATSELAGKDLPEMPFSGVGIARALSKCIPTNSELHLGILNPLRCYNFFPPKCDRVFCNVGGFGIEGNISSLLGASLADPRKLYVGVVGDLSFFYNMNSLGSRHAGKNLRLVVVNNGEGGEFSVPGNISDNPNCGARVHDFIAARGHYGRQSRQLVKSYVEALGFEYIGIESYGALMDSLERLFDQGADRPMVMECFTSPCDDRAGLEAIRGINPFVKEATASDRIKGIIPSGLKKAIKATLGK